MKQNGYTLIETLLAMMIIMMMSILFIPMMNSIQKMYHHPRLSDDLNMIHQLRMELCIHDHITTNGFQLFTDENIYEYHSSRLIKRPGYVIYLQDIDDASFYEKNDHIYLQYQRQQQTYKVYLCEKT